MCVCVSVRKTKVMALNFRLCAPRRSRQFFFLAVMFFAVLDTKKRSRGDEVAAEKTAMRGMLGRTMCFVCVRGSC